MEDDAELLQLIEPDFQNLNRFEIFRRENLSGTADIRGNSQVAKPLDDF